MTSSEQVLGRDGRVAKKLPGYEVRNEQLEMADAVAAAFDTGEHLLVEAGTGVGKSFAYLIPAIEHVTEHGGRVVISTHTIALQEQLIHKDIPFLRSVLPQEFSAVLVKGRGNYIGLRRLARTSVRQLQFFGETKKAAALHAIEDWAYETQDGSRSDLPEEPDGEVWDRVRSDADDCLGRRCPQYSRCFYQRARRRAVDAQVLIVNHALLFADLAVRRNHASILPDYEYVVLDEAHTIERVAGDHLGIRLSDAQVRYLLNTLNNERTGRGVLKFGPGEKAIPAVKETRRVANEFFSDLASWNEQRDDQGSRLRDPPPVEQPLTAALVELADCLRGVRKEVSDQDDRSELGGMIERCGSLGKQVQQWHAQESDGWVYWVEGGTGQAGRWGSRRRVTLNGRPIDVGPELKASLFDRVRSAVMTSATLTTAASEPFEYLRSRLGVEKAKALALGSPFDYRKQLTVHVHADLPDPGNTAAFIPAVCKAIERRTLQTRGRAFVLFTSYGMLRQCAELLADFFKEHEMPLLVQGSGLPRSKMLDQFRTVPRSVLFGTDTFWTGVDVPGEALSNVIIVKLPFAVPNEPVVEARIERIRESGGNPFLDFQIPEAILKFRQGIGRLIRSREDTGIVVILDPRVKSKPYGRRFLAALPDCEVIVDRS